VSERETWRRLLDAIDADAPPALEVADRLADARDLDVVDAQDRVYDAIDDGLLVEGGDGFGGIQLAEDPGVSGETTPETAEEPGSPDETPTPKGEGTGAQTTETGEGRDSDSYHVPLDGDTVAQHYERVRGVYERLATVGEYPTMGLDDLSGWYITQDEHDVERLKDGYKKRRRPASFAKDLDTVLGRVDRTIYGLTTYKSRDAFQRWTPARLNDQNEYEYRGGDNPTPVTEDLRAVSVWGDIDLCDDLKGERGDLDAGTRATAEATLEAYAEEFGKLVGGTDAVYALDSVGGAYIFTAPETTVPIAEYVRDEYGEKWVGEVLREVIDRSNEWLKEAQDRVEERVDGAAGVIDPDWANNHNRKYKAPLSIHKDHDAVVTPLDPDNVDYSITRLDDTDDRLIAEGERWASRFTETEHTDRVATLVGHLFDGSADAWRDAIDQFVERRREEEQQRKQLRQQQTEKRERDLDLDEFDITPRIDDVENAIDALDIESVAGETIVSRWTEDDSDLTDRSGSGKKAIVPSWAGSYNSGNATYIDLDKGIFNDTDDGSYGTAVEMALIDAGGWSRGDIAQGEDWARGVQYLREAGFTIPIWTPDAKTAAGDKMPYWALRSAALALGVLDEDELVERGEDGDTYLGFPDTEIYNDALDAVEAAGLEHGRGRGDCSTRDEFEETDRDLLDVDVVVEPAKALAAAGAVEPDDLDKDLPELEREDVDDVAIAVALAEGRIDGPDQFPGNGGYTEAYYRARDHYGAPLPKYLDNTTLEEREDLVFAALERIGPQHILGSTRSEITVEDPDGVAFAKLNPTWEDSKSGERILAGYGPGFYCVEHDVTFSPIQLVALEHGLIDDETVRPWNKEFTTEAFKQAYRLLREDYGAPLPKWRATILEHVAILPPAVRLIGDSSAGPTLEGAHDKTEALLRDAVRVRDRGQLITNLPGTGKTYSTAVVADETPILYLAQRNELKQQMVDYCREVREDDEDHPDAEPTARHLPIFAENQLPDEVILDAVRAIEEEGRGLLRDREALLDRVDVPEDWDEDDEDAVDLARESCPTADGEHGLGWALAVQTARALEQSPQEIHTHAKALFGKEVPCQHSGDCSYTLGWEDVRTPECADVLIGSPGHAYVGSATTYFEPDGDGGTDETPRAVVVDEFPGDAYMTEYGDRYLDHATWLADALVGVGTREDLTRADLETDTWLNHWLDGEGAELADVAEAIDALNAGAALFDARDEAADLLDSGRLDSVSGTSAALPRVREALEDLAHGAPTDVDLGRIADQLVTAEATVRSDADNAYAADDAEAGALYRLADRLDSVRTSLSVVVERDEDLLGEVERTTETLDVGGDLRRLLDDAVAALRGEDLPDALLEAAVTALQGGREGCRELAIYAEDGYAHPDAWALLAGAIAKDVREVETETFAFDGDEGGEFKHLKKNDATIVADKNQHGALVADHPAFTDITGSKCPLLGLDATGRTALWRLAIGRDTQRRDIHDSDAERRGFLRNAMNLTVVQTTNDPLPYHGNPEGKNFAEDLELVKTVGEELTGPGPDTLDDDAPAVISTLKVLGHLEDELDDLASDTVNYENMKGSDALGDRLVSVILGSCHFGDAHPEKWGLLAGEDAGRGDTRGDTLDYGSDVANTFLKHMREDYTMQAILRAGRNDKTSVVFAHTSALRDDLPVDEEAAVLSAHSKGTLAVAEAAKDLRGEPFTANDIVEAIDGDDRAVGRRQVQNVLADLREGGYLRLVKEGGPGVSHEYDVQEDPGLADAELPEVSEGDGPGAETNEKTANRTLHTWNFRSQGRKSEGGGVTPPARPTIPASEANKSNDERGWAVG